MPTRDHYLMDPGYVAKCRTTLGEAPEKPFVELFIPEEFRSRELIHAVKGPLWELEREVIWPRMAEQLAAGGVRGDLCEFGVFTGGSFRRFIEIFRPLGVIDRYYGFDSFQGLPKPNRERDTPFFWGSESGCSGATREGVQEYLREGLGDLSDVELIEGWFADSLPTVGDRIREVAFARIDCDLYESTREVLAFLGGRLADGAILYFDDWTHDAHTGEARAFFEFAEQEAAKYAFERLLTVSDGAVAVAVKSRR